MNSNVNNQNENAQRPSKIKKGIWARGTSGEEVVSRKTVEKEAKNQTTRIRTVEVSRTKFQTKE